MGFEEVEEGAIGGMAVLRDLFDHGISLTIYEIGGVIEHCHYAPLHALETLDVITNINIMP